MVAGWGAALSRTSFLTCAAHDMPVCIFLRAIMYRPAYGPPIWGFIFPETLAAQFMYFFEENAEVCSIFLYKNRTASPSYVSLLTILYIFKLFYMLLHIIVIIIIYLTDTCICKKTISHILLTYKINFLTIKSWIVLARKC